MNSKGKIYLVSTPIGNMGDITYRSVEILKEVDFILAEDTRRARKLMSTYDIHVPVESYHSHNEHGKTTSVLRRIENGETLALLTDAGSPCLSDPGFLLVRDAVEMGIEPEVLPGASALTFAVAAAGVPVDKFLFEGFLPTKKGKRKKRLEQIKEINLTAFIYESPYRINKLLLEIADIFDENTQIILIREATKFFEERIRGTAHEILEKYKEKKWKGEFVLVISRVLL
ncbi:MAG: 16S rRNA (cytidine(1402)-2'-O)-methyltransferase [Verrucomicrobiota bacterium]|nr:16S rRNA (cytidine(1402)-2'-O)-methyltransferase [Verrucomicrobiota bacterium]